MKIGELAAATNTKVETIRYYESEGLLPAPDRSDSNYRIYGAAHLERLLFIRQCRSLDMSLAEIRSLLRFKDAPAENCGEVNKLLDEHILHVASRIRELRGLEKQLKSLRERCHATQASAHCGILTELSHTESSGANRIKPITHVHGAHRGKHVKK